MPRRSTLVVIGERGDIDEAAIRAGLGISGQGS
jgi:cobalamin biosynthesis protein CobW